MFGLVLRGVYKYGYGLGLMEKGARGAYVCVKERKWCDVMI